MKACTGRVPSVADLLREQLDAVSSIALGKLKKKDFALVDEYLFGEEQLSDLDKAHAEKIAATVFLGLVISQGEELIVANDTFSQLIKSHMRPSPRQYEEFYAYKFVAKLADIARRAANVSSLWTMNPPSREVAALCREAYDTYIHGYHLASVAVIRSVVEARLKEVLGKDLLALEKDPKFGELKELAREQGLYKEHIFKRIDEIRKCGNRALHNTRHPTEQQNLTMIKHAQAALEYFHRQRPPSA